MTNEDFSQQIVNMMQTLYRVSYSQLSQSCDRDEAVQECLLKAWQKRDQLKEPRYMQSWVVRILINECRNIQRKRWREVPLDELPERVAPADADYELHNALLNMDEKLRLPIILHYMEGFTVREIADILRWPQGTVKSRMNRGRAQLKKSLTGEVYTKSCKI